MKMKLNKILFGTRGARAWVIVTAAAVALMLVVVILANTVLLQLLYTVLGKPRRNIVGGRDKIYTLSEGVTDKTSARKNSERVNEAICEEGFVLLKNQNAALPLAAGAKISVFGKNSADIVTGGSGSGAGTGEYVKGLHESLGAAGFSVNPTLREFYASNASGDGRSQGAKMDNDGNIFLKTGETPQSSYTAAVKDSYSSYKDAALIVLSRIGGEGWDLPRAMADKDGNPVEGARDKNDHYLQLDANERDLIQAVCGAGFGKVVVILNSASPVEAGFLDDPAHYAYNAGLDAAIWIGAPGDTGIMALGRVLTGEANPSGRTVGTYARDFKADPTWANFGNNLTHGGQEYTNIGNKDSKLVYAFVDYEEGIYVGYRYWETRGHTDGEDWYRRHVVYPMGYGLSYTAFTQELLDKPSLSSALTAAGKFEVRVKVTNVGARAGKDTAQIYVTVPYINGGIEKAHAVLAGFAKTPLLAPGASATVAVEIDPYDLASYDYADKNGNGFKGWELDAGAYTFKLSRDAHTVIDSFDKTLAAGVQYGKDPVTGTPVVNRYDDADDQLGSVLSRADWDGTFPKTRAAREKALDAAVNAAINSVAPNNPIDAAAFPKQGVKGETVLRDLIGKGYDDPLWEQLLNRMTVNEMLNLVNKGAFNTQSVNSVGKPMTVDADGPGGFTVFMGDPTVYGTSHFACEPVLAATYNTELAFAMGEAVGDEGLVGNERGDGAPYSGWYAPGVNIHRSPFGGRTGEYFSEDGLLSGLAAAAEIRGATSKGLYTMVKHFAANEQETSRTGVCTWLTEQSLREIYLRPFEKAVKAGGTTGMMSSFNRIGTRWTGGDYRLLTEILRGEWGFRGTVISDFNTGSHMHSGQMAYAGGDLNLQTIGQDWSVNKADPNDLTVLRNAAKNILYTVARSNAMNDEVSGYRLPVWDVILIASEVAVTLGLAAWGFFAIRGSIRKQKAAALEKSGSD
ncbi:MAG: glycoside hydrolase family 3 C-terminal domain-containing protein [Clostridiales bacterium]|jgi:beta-glucosidase|nr:glycoside hydrolase family 3 C-terminal domain-containing protein [Clostridiales bacterium]